MTTGEWLIVFATFAGPIAAVQAQKYIERYRENGERKLRLFKTLMATRATKLNFRHVEALNAIDLEFNRAKDKVVVVKWKEYLDHLNLNVPNLKPEEVNAHYTQWNAKSDDLFASLLHEMGKALNYDFDVVHIKKACYHPKGHADEEGENKLVRLLLLQVLEGKRPLPLAVVSMPETVAEPENADLIKDQARMRKAALEVMEGTRPLVITTLDGSTSSKK